MTLQTENSGSRYLSLFRVPHGSGFVEWTITYTVYPDGSITLPGELSQEQKAALVAYLTYNNEHMKERRGNSLSQMSDEQSALYWQAIDTLKTPEQNQREQIEAYVLSQHQSTLRGCTPAISYFDEEPLEDWTEYNVIPDSQLWNVHVSERYAHARYPRVDTTYIVVKSPEQTLAMLFTQVKRTDSDDDE